MGWEQRRYDERGGGGGAGGRFREGLSRMFSPGTSFFDWSLPLFTASGIRVRVHLLFLVWIAVQLATSGGGLGLTYTAIGMATLFVIVLLHEFGHCFACRWVGGEADQILMWPLGGLASCRPPREWRADLITTLGGPAVNVALLPVLGGVLLGLGQGWGSVVFNPFSPGSVVGLLALADGSRPVWLVAVWMAYFTNLSILAFNMLVPMFPMDAGRTLQGILWWRIGRRASMEIATTIGLVTAVVLGVISITSGQSVLLGIALFGGITCWTERMRLRMGAWEDDEGAYVVQPAGADDARAARQRERIAKERERARVQAEKDQVELDRILEKIRVQGMGALTGSEKKWLQRETEKRRGA